MTIIHPKVADGEKRCQTPECMMETAACVRSVSDSRTTTNKRVRSLYRSSSLMMRLISSLYYYVFVHIAKGERLKLHPSVLIAASICFSEHEVAIGQL